MARPGTTPQPFKATEPARHPLAVLARVNNADKHAALHAAVAYHAPVDQTVVSVEPTTPVEIDWSAEPLTPLEYGAEMTRYRVVVPVPPRFRVFLNWPLAVQFTDQLGRHLHFYELPDIFDAAVGMVGHWDEEVRAGRGR